MKSPVRRLVLAAFLLAAGVHSLRAQDSMRGAPEPIVSAIDPAALTYDYLVDGNLAQDNPAARQFKTLQAAYAAAPAGTAEKPTVIGIKPNVYQLPGRAPRGPSLSITKDYLTLLGLTNNRRAVVLADNRGLMEGADDDGYILDVNAIGFTARNLTIVNYCNNDYEYPGDPSKNLAKRSDVITQGVALQAAGDKHVYENVALLGRLDTMFLRTQRSYFRNVYIEGTDDWMGGGQISVWEDSTLVYPTGRGVMSASNVIFRQCRFEATHGMQFYKAEFRSAERPDVLIDCVLPVNTRRAAVAWVRGIAAPRPGVLSLTYRNHDAAGHPAVIRDATVGPPAFTYSRELTDQEVLAYNPWNLLRAAPGAAPDDWDPAGDREKYAAAGDLPFRMTLTGGSPTLRTGGPSVALGAAVTPPRAAAASITWSTKSSLVALTDTTGPRVTVAARNTTDQAEWVAIEAAAATGLTATAYVYVEPKFIDPPAVTAGPTLNPPADGAVAVVYALALGGRRDESLITWYVCDDAAGTNSRKVAVSRGDAPLRTLPLTPGYVGKYLRVTLQPKIPISEPGDGAQAAAKSPVQAADVPSADVSPNFRNFVADANPAYASGLWTVLGAWGIVAGDNYANGYGIRPIPPARNALGRPGEGPAALLYQEDSAAGDMRVDVTMAPEKTEGTGFSIPGSPADNGPRNLHADILIKYDPRTKTGYSLRFWRTISSAGTCMYQFYRIENGTGTPLDDRQVLSGVFKPTTHLILQVVGTKITARASNDVDKATLSLEGTIVPNRFGGGGVTWPRGSSSNIYSRIAVAYPGGLPGK